MRFALLNAMRKFGTVVKKDYQGTTKTWTHKPYFEIAVSLKGPGPELLVGTDDDQYRRVDEGTGIYATPPRKPYKIEAGYWTGKSNKKALAFPSMFTPKTRPGSLVSGPGGSGGDTVVVRSVMHKGIRPRHFSEQIAKQDEPKYKRAMEEGMRKARDVSGNPA
jgi:hypothetical protein